MSEGKPASGASPGPGPDYRGRRPDGRISWGRIVVAVLGLALLSPANLYLSGVLFPDFSLALVIVLYGVGTILALRGFRRPSLAIVLACVLNLPLLASIGLPEQGEWAQLFAIPSYFIFLLAGVSCWWSRRRADPAYLRWLGVVAPSGAFIHVV
jgi:hypothetical protein